MAHKSNIYNISYQVIKSKNMEYEIHLHVFEINHDI